MVQNVFPVYLVVEQVETVVRLFLRFLVQLPLKHPDLNRCLQAHRQSPVLSFFESTSEVRVLPSAGALPGVSGTATLSDFRGDRYPDGQR